MMHDPDDDEGAWMCQEEKTSKFNVKDNFAKLSVQTAANGTPGAIETGYSSFSLGYPETAALSVNSITKGFAPPRMTYAQRIAITGSTGLMVYQTTGATYGQTGPYAEGLYIYHSAGWTGPAKMW